jgi:predicted site-specific integrase-resolvase
MSDDGPITSAEVGVILGVSARTVQRFAMDGELAYIRKLPGPNGDYLFDETEVLRFAAGRAEAAS